MVHVNIKRLEMGLDDMQTLVQAGHLVRETPHLGMASGKDALTMGGLIASKIVLVDTTTGRDKKGQAHKVNGLSVLSNSQAERRPAAALNALSLDAEKLAQVSEAVVSLGIQSSEFVRDGKLDLVALQVHCVQRVAVEDMAVTTFADHWHKSGDVGQAMMQYMAMSGKVRRWYDASSGKIKDTSGQSQTGLLATEGSYFDQGAAGHINGALAPVEALFALEAVLALRDGREQVYDQLCNNSQSYTQDASFAETVTGITHGTLAELGDTSSASLDYGLIVADNSHLDKLGNTFMQGAASHFEMLEQGRQFSVV